MQNVIIAVSIYLLIGYGWAFYAYTKTGIALQYPILARVIIALLWPLVLVDLVYAIGSNHE